MGREAIAALGLKNVHLEPDDILKLGPGLGEFDYIIAHGVYSWVPAEVRSDGARSDCRARPEERTPGARRYSETRPRPRRVRLHHRPRRLFLGSGGGQIGWGAKRLPRSA